MKILVTGGHVTPAIAVIEEIEKQHPDWDIVFLGRKFAMEGEKEVSAEYRVITDMGVRFLPITAGRLQRSVTRYALLLPIKFIIGLMQSIQYVAKEKPNIIISFGGYVALPVVIAGWMQRIPSITHEQTTTVGEANYWIAKIAKKICVSFPDMVDKFPKEKTVYTGLPVRKELFQISRNHLFATSPTHPLIYIAGGATGSESINSMIMPVLPELLDTYTIIHQTGYASYVSIQKKTALLPANLKSRYHVVPYLPVSDLAWVYQKAKIYIGRSGANTVGEIALLGKVAIFIPLPWAAQNEQTKNAKVLEQAGSAVIVTQEDSSPETLLQAIHKVFEAFDAFQQKATEFSKTIVRDGASRIVTQVTAVYQ